jgi:hypothetical protein
VNGSPIGALRNVEAVPTEVKTVASIQSITPNFWQEFLRVQCDKFILLGLIIFLWRVGAHDEMKYAIGGLIVAINHNRFKWN